MPTIPSQGAATAGGGGRSGPRIGLLLLSLALLGCDATPQGHLVVELALHTAEGDALGCADLGAQEVELSLFARGGDVLPYDRVTWPCATEPHTLTVDAQRYARVEARLVGSGGATVRLCGPEGTVEARFSTEDLAVSPGATASLPWALAGSPGSCPAPAPPPGW